MPIDALAEALWKEMDNNNEGRVLKTVLMEQIMAIDSELPEAQLRAVLDEMDINHTGYLDYNQVTEFLRLFLSANGGQLTDEPDHGNQTPKNVPLSATTRQVLQGELETVPTKGPSDLASQRKQGGVSFADGTKEDGKTTNRPGSGRLSMTTDLKRMAKELFREFDKDQSGFISKDEFTAGILRLHPAGSPQQINAIFNKLDLDGDNFINEDEFAENYTELLVLAQAEEEDDILNSARSARRRAKEEQQQLRELSLNDVRSAADYREMNGPTGVTIEDENADAPLPSYTDRHIDSEYEDEDLKKPKKKTRPVQEVIEDAPQKSANRSVDAREVDELRKEKEALDAQIEQLKHENHKLEEEFRKSQIKLERSEKTLSVLKAEQQATENQNYDHMKKIATLEHDMKQTSKELDYAREQLVSSKGALEAVQELRTKLNYESKAAHELHEQLTESNHMLEKLRDEYGSLEKSIEAYRLEWEKKFRERRIEKTDEMKRILSQARVIRSINDRLYGLSRVQDERDSLWEQLVVLQQSVEMQLAQSSNLANFRNSGFEEEDDDDMEDDMEDDEEEEEFDDDDEDGFKPGQAGRRRQPIMNGVEVAAKKISLAGELQEEAEAIIAPKAKAASVGTKKHSLLDDEEDFSEPAIAAAVPSVVSEAAAQEAARLAEEAAKQAAAAAAQAAERAKAQAAAVEAAKKAAEDAAKAAEAADLARRQAAEQALREKAAEEAVREAERKMQEAEAKRKEEEKEIERMLLEKEAAEQSAIEAAVKAAAEVVAQAAKNAAMEPASVADLTPEQAVEETKKRSSLLHAAVKAAATEAAQKANEGAAAGEAVQEAVQAAANAASQAAVLAVSTEAVERAAAQAASQVVQRASLTARKSLMMEPASSRLAQEAQEHLTALQAVREQAARAEEEATKAAEAAEQAFREAEESAVVERQAKDEASKAADDAAQKKAHALASARKSVMYQKKKGSVWDDGEVMVKKGLEKKTSVYGDMLTPAAAAAAGQRTHRGSKRPTLTEQLMARMSVTVAGTPNSDERVKSLNEQLMKARLKIAHHENEIAQLKESLKAASSTASSSTSASRGCCGCSWDWFFNWGGSKKTEEAKKPNMEPKPVLPVLANIPPVPRTGRRSTKSARSARSARKKRTARGSADGGDGEKAPIVPPLNIGGVEVKPAAAFTAAVGDPALVNGTEAEPKKDVVSDRMEPPPSIRVIPPETPTGV